MQTRTENVAYHCFHPSDWGSKLSGSLVSSNEMLQNFLMNRSTTMCGEWPHMCHSMFYFFFQGVIKRQCYNLTRNLQQQNLYENI